MIRIFIILALIAPSLVQAETTSNSSSVTLVEPLTMTQSREMNFGKVLVPSSGSNLVRLKGNGDYHSSTTGTIGNFQESAQFKITGDPNSVVEYTSVSVSSTIPGVTFDRLYHTASQTINNNGKKNLNVGARIYVSSTATPGVYDNGELSYTIQVEYQ